MTAARPDGFRLSLSTIYTAAAAASDRLITYKTDLIPLSPDISFTLQLRTLQFHNRNLLLHTPYPRANTSKPPTYNTSTLIRDILLTSYFVLFATIFFFRHPQLILTRRLSRISALKTPRDNVPSG